MEFETVRAGAKQQVVSSDRSVTGSGLIVLQLVHASLLVAFMTFVKLILRKVDALGKLKLLGTCNEMRQGESLKQTNCNCLNFTVQTLGVFKYESLPGHEDVAAFRAYRKQETKLLNSLLPAHKAKEKALREKVTAECKIDS